MRYRVYFHKRDGKHPVVWSVDEGDQTTEVHVQWVTLGDGVAAFSAVNLEAKDGEPAAWVEIHNAQCAIANGGALFSRIPREDWQTAAGANYG